MQIYHYRDSNLEQRAQKSAAGFQRLDCG